MYTTISSEGKPKKRLRVLQAHSFYNSYLSKFYAEHPELQRMTSTQQTTALIKDGLAAVHILPPYLENLDCEAKLVIMNCTQIQSAWAQEHQLHVPPTVADQEEYILRAQITAYKPDVLYLVGDYLKYGARFIDSLNYTPPLIMGWRGADVYAGTDLRGYDLILSGLTPMLHLATSLGAKEGVYFVPGMPHWIAREVENIPQDLDVVFAGGISPTQHVKRLALLDLVAQAAHKHGFSLALYLACDPALITDAMRPYTHPPVFGLDMHRTLRRGRIVLDIQGTIGLRRPDGTYALDLAQGETINMRLFEATGGGSLLLTEQLPGLHTLFEPSKEVATYSTPTELVNTLLYYLQYEEERHRIAMAGKAHCLGQWSMQQRARAFLDIIHQHGNFHNDREPTTSLSKSSVEISNLSPVLPPLLPSSKWSNSVEEKQIYPNIFAIETVLGCNLRCVECAVGANLVRRPYGHMTLAQFMTIAERIRPYCTYAYLHIWGEPMINPDIIPMLKAASTFTHTNISTNANTLDEHLAKDLINSGVTSIIVSIDGMSQEIYSTYRRRGILSKAQLGLVYLTKHKMKSGRHVKILPQFIVFKHNQCEMSAFEHFCQELGLQAVFKAPYLRQGSSLHTCGLPDFERDIAASPAQRRQNMRACTLDKDCNILLDGSVVSCCYDHNGQTTFGNIYTQSLEEIWQNPAYRDFRRHVHAGEAPEFCMSQCLAY